MVGGIGEIRTSDGADRDLARIIHESVGCVQQALVPWCVAHGWTLPIGWQSVPRKVLLAKHTVMAIRVLHAPYTE